MTERNLKVTDLSPAEVEFAKQAMNTTWATIAYDCIDGNGGKAMKRDDVIDVVLDADYMETYAARKPEEKELLKRFRQLSYPEMQKLARTTFTYARYGL